MALGEWCLEVKRPGRELHLCQNQKVNKQIQANWWLGCYGGHSEVPQTEWLTPQECLYS